MSFHALGCGWLKTKMLPKPLTPTSRCQKQEGILVKILNVSEVHS